jgi:hypothetical protein
MTITALHSDLARDVHQARSPRPEPRASLERRGYRILLLRRIRGGDRGGEASNPITPKASPPYRWLAASLGQTGQTEGRKEALEKAIAIAPALFDMYVRRRAPWMRPEDHAHVIEGLRKAGLRET